MSYSIENLTRQQVSDVYHKWIHLHFPRNEIKPLKNIHRMWDADSYCGLGMYQQTDEKKELIGYAFFAKAPGSTLLLLDYFAIVEEYRGCGLGSLFLGEMRKRFTEYKGILIETEDIDFSHGEKERLTRQKRDAFYAKNNAVKTSIQGEVYGVHYAIWNLPVSGPVLEEDCKRSLEEVYQIMIPGKKYEWFVKIRIKK